jgi:hypothetical protein
MWDHKFEMREEQVHVGSHTLDVTFIVGATKEKGGAFDETSPEMPDSWNWEIISVEDFEGADGDGRDMDSSQVNVKARLGPGGFDDKIIDALYNQIDNHEMQRVLNGQGPDVQSVPTMESLEILAVSDIPTFTKKMRSLGLKILGRTDPNPLNKMVQSESIAAISSQITEDVSDPIYRHADKRIMAYKQMAEDYGFIVGFIK